MLLESLGSTANVIGAFDLGVSFLTEASAELRKQARNRQPAQARPFRPGVGRKWKRRLGRGNERSRGIGSLCRGDRSCPLDRCGYDRQGEDRRHARRSETVRSARSQAERLILSIGASFLLAMLQLARGISAIGAGRHGEAFEHLQRLFAPADPAFNSGLQFYALADFVEAAVYSDSTQAACSVIEEIERVSAPTPVPWVETMLCYAKALVATNEDAEHFFLQGLGPAAKNWPFLRGRSSCLAMAGVAAPTAQVRQRAGSTTRGSRHFRRALA